MARAADSRLPPPVAVMTTWPSVSVIVPLKDDDRLLECLTALSAQDYPAGLVEVIVVDNGSTHSPQPVIDRFPIARLLHEPRAGSYAAATRASQRQVGSCWRSPMRTASRRRPGSARLRPQCVTVPTSSLDTSRSSRNGPDGHARWRPSRS